MRFLFFSDISQNEQLRKNDNQTHFLLLIDATVTTPTLSKGSLKALGPSLLRTKTLW